jgi:hypothetical protein
MPGCQGSQSYKQGVYQGALVALKKMQQYQQQKQCKSRNDAKQGMRDGYRQAMQQLKQREQQQEEVQCRQAQPPQQQQCPPRSSSGYGQWNGNGNNGQNWQSPYQNNMTQWGGNQWQDPYGYNNNWGGQWGQNNWQNPYQNGMNQWGGNNWQDPYGGNNNWGGQPVNANWNNTPPQGGWGGQGPGCGNYHSESYYSDGCNTAYQSESSGPGHYQSENFQQSANGATMYSRTSMVSPCNPCGGFNGYY